MRRPRRPAKAGGGGGGGEKDAEGVAAGVKDAEGVAVIAIDGEVLGFPMVAAAGDGGAEEGTTEDGVAVFCVKDALDGAPVIAADGEGEAPVLGVPVVALTGDGGGEKGPLEDGVAVGVKDALDGAPVIAADGEGEAPVLGVPVVWDGAGEKAPPEDGVPVGEKDALDGPLAVAADGEGEAPVQEGVPAIAVKGNGKAEKDEEGIKWLKHYSSAQSILIVGDGDFSFSLALATAFGSGENLVATSLDSYEDLTSKYGKAETNVKELKRLAATVLHGVDAKAMKFHSCLKMRRFDRIVFNFPHAGFKGKEDHLHVINAHKQLVHGFFANARHLLRPYGETHVSHKTGLPYDTWDIEQLANDSCLVMVRKVNFSKEDYPGYDQKRGDSAKCDQPFALGPCCTFMFCLGDVKKLKKAQENRVGSVSCLGDSKFYSGMSATAMRPFDLYPLAPAWPQPHFPPGSRVHMPAPFNPYPFGVAEMDHPGVPVNYYGAERAPYFHQHDMAPPICTGPPPNVFPSQGQGVFNQPMRILGNPEQPLYQEGPPIEQPWIGDRSCSPQGYQSLQREYDILRQQMLSPEDRYMESVQRRARLEMLIQVYGRQ